MVATKDKFPLLSVVERLMKSSPMLFLFLMALVVLMSCMITILN